MKILKNNKKVKYKIDGEKVLVEIPENMRDESIVLKFKIK
jgi:hypothetical protein